MANIPNIFVNGRMDSDTNYTLVDNKGYVYALNLRPSGYGEDGTMHSIKGSSQRSDYSEDKTMTVVGMYNGENNKLYTFLARRDGLSKITETDIITKATRLIIEDAEFLRFDLLRWEDCEESERKYLLSINQIDNYLVFSNEVWEDIRTVEIDGNYTNGFELEDIVLAKKPPKEAPLIISSSGVTSNSSENQKNRFVSFAYRYKYANGSYSPFSFYSDVAFKEFIGEMTTNDKRENTAMVNQYSAVKIAVNSGDFRVKGIEVIAREHGTRNGYIIYSATKGETEYNGLPITDNQNLEIQYNFSSNYTLVNEQLLDLIYSNYPKFPKAQDYVGSRLFFANYKEGFDLKDENGEKININIDYELQSTDIDYSVSKKTATSMFSYKTGIVYYDDFNEATTVLSNSNDVENEVYVGFEKRTKINKILAKINNNPPARATKFKFVVQHQKLNYENVFSGLAEKVNDKLYILLDNDNINKVKKGDKVFLNEKSIPEYTELTVNDVQLLSISDYPMLISGAYAIIEGVENLNLQTNAGDQGKKINSLTKFSAQGQIYIDIDAMDLSINDSIPNQPIFGDVKVNDKVTITFDFKFRTKIADSFLRENNYKKSEIFIADANYSNVYDFVKSNITNINFDVTNTSSSINFSPNEYLKLWLQQNTGIESLNDSISDLSFSVTIELKRGNKAQFLRTINKETLDTFYYESPNTFKILNGVHVGAVGGFFDTGFYNGYAWGNGVESYKIKDDFNANALDFRFRPNGIDPNGYGEKWRKNDITYSGLYNGDFKINDLNIYNPALINWKELPTEYGEIQRIVSTDGDISVFCNDKIFNVLYGKSIIADLQGNENVALTNEVLGGIQTLPYPFGTQNPESVIKTNEGIAFVDKKRARYLLKSGNQIAELNPDGSGHHYHGVKEIQQHTNFLASYNQAHGEYIFGLDHCDAVVFAPSKKGFSHYYDFSFDYIKGMNGKHFTAYKGIVYEDEVNDYANGFAGSQNKKSKLKYVVNPEMGIDKIYKALKLQSNTPWDVSIKTNLTETQFTQEAFTKKESYYFSEIYRDTATLQNSQGIGVIQNIVGNNLEFSYKVGIEVSVGDKMTQENGVYDSEITNIQGKIITVADSSVFSIGDYVFASKQSDGFSSPDGAPQRGKFMEVTLTNYGNEPYYITSAHTEIVKSNL
jgi:hypothetical protein